MALTASFVRHRGRRDRIYVTRSDATEVFWDFPSYGEGLPHDLVHLVVEDGLGIVNGFWGLVDQGAGVQLVNNQATLVRAGTPLVDIPGVDFSGLKAAERAVAGLARGVDQPDGSSEAAVASTRQRLAELARRWRETADGDALILTFEGGGPDDVTTRSVGPRRCPRWWSR
jgi:hypothetical protein